MRHLGMGGVGSLALASGRIFSERVLQVVMQSVRGFYGSGGILLLLSDALHTVAVIGADADANIAGGESSSSSRHTW